MDRPDVIILAGGLGTRLRGVLPDVQKVLAPVGGRPFLDLILESLAGADICDRVVIAAGHRAEQLVERYREASDFPFSVRISVEEVLLGTGGAIRKALDLTATERILALNGDSRVEFDYRGLMREHERKGAAMTLVVKAMEETGRYGRVVLGDDGRVLSFEEKREGAGPGYINAGVYLFERRLFDDVPGETVVSLERDLLPRFLGKGVYGYVTEGKFIDIGTPESYRDSTSYV
jgi:NDP-sugar pyrophosphorylase family protein